MRHRPALSPVARLRPLGRLLATPLVAGALAAGCADPAGPASAAPDPAARRPSLIKEVDGRQRVFNVQLRAVEDPNIIDDPNLRPHGHLQLKLTRLADGSVRLAWKGQIHNPGGLTFSGWSLNDLDNGRPLLLVAFGEVDGRSRRIDPEDATIISAELAARLYGTPDTIDDPNIRVVFLTARGPALAGTL
jgi:hypothetical protein